MRYLKIIQLLCLSIVLALYACDKEGGFQDVDVTVKRTDQNWYPLPDNSGVTVALNNGNETFKEITSENGNLHLPLRLLQ